MDRQEPSQVLLGDYDISQRCDCLESLCAPLPQEVISINLSIYLYINLSLFQSISLSIYLYWFNWYCNCHWLVKRTKINKKGRRWSIIAITKDVLLQISVEEIRLHEGYNGNGDRSEGELISNDIALIRLAKPAELNPGIHWFKHALRYTHMQTHVEIYSHTHTLRYIYICTHVEIYLYTHTLRYTHIHKQVGIHITKINSVKLTTETSVDRYDWLTSMPQATVVKDTQAITL